MGSVVQEVTRRLRPAYRSAQRRLLLVEEDTGDLRYYFGVLRALGYTVVVAQAYEHALSLLEQETFDLVIVGQGSPAFEGRSVVVRARELHPEIPVVVVARAMDIDCYLEAMELGASDYVEKSATPRDFMLLIDSHLEVESAA